MRCVGVEKDRGKKRETEREKREREREREREEGGGQGKEKRSSRKLIIDVALVPVAGSSGSLYLTKTFSSDSLQRAPDPCC